MLRRDLSGDDRRARPRQMEVRRALDRHAPAVDLFGNGRWSRVYRIGPHRRLLGRTAGHAASPARGRAAGPVRGARATCAGSIPPAAEVPTLAAGRLKGGSATGGRDVALAVNGRIAAVGRSFHLAGDRTEWFALNLPVSALRKGRNAMSLYAVEPDLRLTPLGGAQ